MQCKPHIYQRGGELIHFIGDNTEVLTTEDVKRLLQYVFSFGGIQRLLSEMLAIRRGEKPGSMEELLSNATAGSHRRDATTGSEGHGKAVVECPFFS